IDLASFTFDLNATELSHVLNLLEGDLLAQDRPNVLDVLVVLAHAKDVVDVQQEVHLPLSMCEQARVVLAGHETTSLQYSRDMEEPAPGALLEPICTLLEFKHHARDLEPVHHLHVDHLIEVSVQEGRLHIKLPYDILPLGRDGQCDSDGGEV